MPVCRQAYLHGFKPWCPDHLRTDPPSERQIQLTEPDLQILGLTRWSYPFKGTGFRKADRDLDALRAQLYAPERLNHRLFLLRHILLPGLRAQTDARFTHVFLIGDGLPEPWKSQLLTLLETVPQIVPVLCEEGRGHKDLCREILHRHRDPAAQVVAEYRLDDDDGLARTFVAQTRKCFCQMRSVLDQGRGMAIDFSRGFVFDSAGETLTLDPVSMRFWAAGMAVSLPPDSTRCVMDINHLKVWHSIPTLTLPTAPMFLRGRHKDNDSGFKLAKRGARGFPFDPPDPMAYFAQVFGVDIVKAQDAWDGHRIP